MEGSPIAIALWAAGKAPEKLTACSQRFLEGKIKKTTFQALKSCFLKFASWKVLPLQLRFGQLEKHLKSSLPALKGVWMEGKIKKTTFQALKNCFLKFASWKGLPLQLRFGQLEKHLKSSLPALNGKKTTFQALKSCFLKFASWKGLPLQLRFGQLEKHLKSSLPALKGGENQKNNFSGSEKLFFEICQLEGSPIAIALWEAGKAPEKLTACSQGCLDGVENQKKQLFRL